MSGQIITETVSEKETGARLDRWLKRRMNVTQGQVEKLLRTGQIRVNGGRAKANTRLETADEVRFPIFASEDAGARKAATARRISEEDREFLRSIIIYEDDDMLAINKPAGLAVQGGSGQGRHVDGLLAGMEEDGHRPVLVHRLDKDTSGVLLLAKHPAAAARLTELFRGREMDKVYWAVTVGVPSPQAGQIRCWMVKGVPDINEPSGYRPVDPYATRRRDGDRERMIRSAQGVEGAKHSITDYAVVSTAGPKAAWVALRPETGRMHQLRFHMLEMNTSILGDHKYKSRREVPHGLAEGLHLHARALIIPREHGKPIKIIAPLPPHMKETFETLGFLEQEAGKDPLAPFI
ncbi:RluA family pseudouridine synthase [Hyphomonas polymorpha PS728]|uniref:RluA family pseudouridine synthase n=1 Tax=Hyphomonas polymorpha PS728 TaxID=1280954 RepID=A0A062V4I3_9PROT|nr:MULTISPECIES: RluA family pseudouridine synthase [Hyphomonas]AXE65021.1 pseudouridine synthase [Hyphomonas sp. CACIAM 19H1]KCZ96793.1 RluA family pseudouridine synthase [Hyphomonas polymorpha PS728]